jgi:hypothetical protein
MKTSHCTPQKEISPKCFGGNAQLTKLKLRREYTFKHFAMSKQLSSMPMLGYDHAKPISNPYKVQQLSCTKQCLHVQISIYLRIEKGHWAHNYTSRISLLSNHPLTRKNQQEKRTTALPAELHNLLP